MRSTRRTVESLALLLDERIERLASTVHIDEVVEGDDDASRGQRRSSATCPAFNGTAPHLVRNAEFSRLLGRTLGRPARLPMPGFAMRLIVGEMADELLLQGQRVLPERALHAGFPFRHPDLEGALADLLG